MGWGIRLLPGFRIARLDFRLRKAIMRFRRSYYAVPRKLWRNAHISICLCSSNSRTPPFDNQRKVT